MKALVEPFPLVPAMCMGLRPLKSDGCEPSQPYSVRVIIDDGGGSHLVP